MPADTAPRPDTKRELPYGWRWARLREVIREAQLGFASGQRDPRGVLQLRMNNVTSRGRFDWSSVIRVPADLEIITAYRLEPGDVLFNNTNSTDLVGKTALFEGHAEPVVFSNHFTRLRVIRDGLSPEFLSLWLQEQWQRRVFENICNRWIGQAAVHREKLLSLEIPFPPLEEQKRIAAILNEQMATVDRARGAAEAQLEAAKTLPAAYLRAVFDSPEAQQWPRRRLGIISEIVGGIQKTPGRAPVRLHRPYLTVRNVQRGYLDLSRVERFEVTEAELSRLRLIPGDILIVEGNGSVDEIGRNALFTIDSEEWIHQNHVIRVRLSADESVPEFVSLFLNSDQGRSQMIEKAKTTSGLYTLSSSKVASLEVPLPPLPEQQRIVARLSEQMAAAEQTRKALEAHLDTINALPAALLRRAFNGEL